MQTMQMQSIQIKIPMPKGIAIAQLATKQTVNRRRVWTGKYDVWLHLNGHIFLMYRGYEPNRFVTKFIRHKYPISRTMRRKAEHWGQYSTLG